MMKKFVFCSICVALSLVGFLSISRCIPTKTARKAIAGEIIMMPLRITPNEFETIESVRMSCGCTRLLDHLGKDLLFPFSIASSGADLQIEVSTIGKIGVNTISVVITGSKRGKSKTTETLATIDCLPGFGFEPSLLKHENCKPGEMFETEVRVFRHADATRLKVEDHILSNSETMQLELLETDEKVTYSGTSELIGVYRLRYASGDEFRQETLTFIGLGGQVRGQVQLIFEPRPQPFDVKPKKLYFDRGVSSQVVWLEHVDDCVPTVPNPPAGITVTVNKSSQENKGLYLTKAVVQRLDLEQKTLVGLDEQPVVIEFVCGAHRAAIQVFE